MSLKKQKTSSKKSLNKKDKLREKIYDLVYGTLTVDNAECHCYDVDRCGTNCFAVQGLSVLYDKLIKTLEDAGVHLDKEV